MNQNSHWTCCSSWAEQLTAGCQSFPRTSQDVLRKRRGHCLRKFSQWKWGDIERKTKVILIPTPGDIMPPLFLPKGIQKGDSFKAFLIISLDHRHAVFNHYGWKQQGHYTFIRKITSLHFTLSGNFISKTKRVSNNNKQLKRRKMVMATPQRNFLMVKPISKSDCRPSSENHWLAQLNDWLSLFHLFGLDDKDLIKLSTLRLNSVSPEHVGLPSMDPGWIFCLQI